MYTTIAELAERLHVSEQYAGALIAQVTLHFDEYLRVARRQSVDDVVRVRCAYEAMCEAAKVVVSVAGSTAIPETMQPDEYARAVVERAGRVSHLSSEETRQVRVLNDWGLAGVPAEPPVSADAAVYLAERMLTALLGSRRCE